MDVVMAVVVWGSVVGVLVVIGLLAYRLAVRIDEAERRVREWEEFVASVEVTDPHLARWLRLVRESGDSQQYMAWLMSGGRF